MIYRILKEEEMSNNLFKKVGESVLSRLRERGLEEEYYMEVREIKHKWYERENSYGFNRIGKIFLCKSGISKK